MLFLINGCSEVDTEQYSELGSEIVKRNFDDFAIGCTPESVGDCSTESKFRIVAISPRPNNPCSSCDSIRINYDVQICKDSLGRTISTDIFNISSFPFNDCWECLIELDLTNPGLAATIVADMEYDASLLLEESEVQQHVISSGILCDGGEDYYKSTVYSIACYTYCVKQGPFNPDGSFEYYFVKEQCGRACCLRETLWCLDGIKGYAVPSEPTWTTTGEGCRQMPEPNDCEWYQPCDLICGPR